MSTLWQYEFMRHALLSALFLGPACALLGVFVTLRGMAFFSDALAHSALTGVALGLLLSEVWGVPIDPLLSVLIFSLGLAGLMSWLMRRGNLSPDTVIAFTFTGSVALGVVVISALGKYRLLDGFLFGSIYANNTADLWRQALLLTGLVTYLLWNGRSYALATLNPDLAQVRGIQTARLDLVFALLIGLTVAICLKMLGALLLSALIVIPPAAAKLIALGFRQMLLFSCIGGTLCAVVGVLASWFLNVPTGPCIVLTNIAFLAACFTLRAARVARAV